MSLTPSETDAIGPLPGDARHLVATHLGAARAWLVPAGSTEEALASLGLAGLRPVSAIDPATCAIADVRALARHAREDPLAVDVTLPTMHGCAACRLGADLALDALRGLDGPVGGWGLVAVGLSRDALRRFDLADALDALSVPAPSRLARALGSLPSLLRVRNDNAQVAAAYLSCHPAVAHVAYPGLSSTCPHDLAASVLSFGFGPRVLLRLRSAAGRSDVLPHIGSLEGGDGVRSSRVARLEEVARGVTGVPAPGEVLALDCGEEPATVIVSELEGALGVVL